MKKTLITILLCILIVAILVVTIIIIVNRNKKLVMVTEAGFAPYEFYDGDKIVGVDVEIAQAIAKELGKELIIEDAPFDTLLDRVASGKADFAAAGLSITKDRLKKVDFSIEYAVSKQVIVVKKGSNIKSIDDLNEKRVSVQSKTVADIVLTDEYPKIKVVGRKKYSLAVKDVLMGGASALVMDSIPAESVVAHNPELKILKKELFTDKYGIAVKKGNYALLNKINMVLQKLIKEGKIKEYTIKYLGD